MHNTPSQPLDELEQLRKQNSQLRQQLRDLLTEERIIRATVESIVSHEIDADYKSDDFGGGSEDHRMAHKLTEILVSASITIDVDEESDEITHAQFAGKKFSFHAAEWEWTNEQGIWPWEQADGEYKDDEAWEAHIREE